MNKLVTVLELFESWVKKSAIIGVELYNRQVELLTRLLCHAQLLPRTPITHYPLPITHYPLPITPTKLSRLTQYVNQ